MNQQTSPGKWTSRIPVIAAIIGVLFGGGGLVWIAQNVYNELKPPDFTVAAIGTLGGAEANVYEITDHFIGTAPLSDAPVKWGLEVRPDYHGSKSYGEVRVVVKDSKGVEVVSGQWPNFDKDSKTLSIPLDPFQLSAQAERAPSYNGNIFDNGTYTPPQLTFTVEILQASQMDEPLKRAQLLIRNTPWYHYTTLSKHKDSLDILVYGKNLGGRSDFAVQVDVFEIAKMPGAPFKEWPWKAHETELIPNVDAGKSFTATVTLPPSDSFQLDTGKYYMINTYIEKKQNYIHFSDNSFEKANNGWMLGNSPTQHVTGP